MARLATIASGLLLLAGCGGDDDGAETAREPAPPAGSPAAGTTPSATVHKRNEQGSPDPDAPVTDIPGGSATAAPRRGPGASGGGTSGASRGSRGSRPAAPSPDAGGETAPVPESFAARVKSYVTDYYARLKRGDHKVCTEVYTLRHVEQITMKKGEAALAECRKSIGTGGKFTVISIGDPQRTSRTRVGVISVLELRGRKFNARVIVFDSPNGLRIDGVG